MRKLRILLVAIFFAVNTVLSAQCRYPQLSYFETLERTQTVWIERTKFGGKACLSLPFRCLFSCPLAGYVDCHHREHSHSSLHQLVLQLRTGLCPEGCWPTLAFLSWRHGSHTHTDCGRSFLSFANPLIKSRD